eukprot:279688_1
MTLLSIISFLFAILCQHTLCQQDKPNVLFFIIDDLGWANVGFHNPTNPEVSTPHIDFLAKQGLILNRHYVHFVCCPTRTSFQSGRLPVHVNIERCQNTQQQTGIPQNMTAIGTKMQTAGFETHMYGKWHAGMATMDHTPKGRGYDTSLIYFEAAIDYYSHTGISCKKTVDTDFIDLWEGSPKYNGPAYQFNSSNHRYVESIFAEHVLNTLDNSVNKTKPFFMVYTPHTIHAPLQIPKEWLTNYDNDENNCSTNQQYVFGIYPGGPNISQPELFHCRSIYQSMVKYIDSVIGNITQKLIDTGLWNNTLIVLSSDNGGECALGAGGANNSPLRGGKHAVWEGGIRATAFVSGGWNGLPSHRRGMTENGMIHISDWYVTFCRMFGVDPFDQKAAKHGLPPVEGYNVWPLIIGENETSPRILLPIDNTTLINDNYKLIISEQLIDWACWEGGIYPNASSPKNNPAKCRKNCTNGCLFDIVNDWTEHIDIAENNGNIVKQMNQTLS